MKSNLAVRSALWGAAFLLLSALAPGPVAAQGPTLKTIQIDGDLSDWDPVLLNSLQVTLDGDGSSLPCPFSTDRDCPVNSRGRDLRLFAWTYDLTYLYLYVHRQGSSTNTEAFWIYFDLDLDQRMGTGDKVLNVSYQGGNASTGNDLYSYVPVDPGGDPLVDGGGFADGHTLPGDLGKDALWSQMAPNGGAADGRTFEQRVPWSALGVPSNTPIHYHVASSNPSSPTNLSKAVSDNLGAPTGGLGTFGFDRVDISPDRNGTVAAGASIGFAHTVRNTGNRAATYDLEASSTLGLSVSIDADANGDGIGDARMATDGNGDGDFADPGDSLDPAWDSDGDGFPDTGGLAPQAAFRIVVTIQTSAGPGAVQDATTVTAFLPSRPGEIYDAARDTTDIGAIIVRSDPREKNGVERQLVSYSVEVCNNAGPDTANLEAFSVLGWKVTLWDDPACLGSPGDQLAVDNEGDGTWDVLLAGDSDGDGNPDTGEIATGRCACFVAQISIPGAETIGTRDDTRIQATGAGGEGNVTLATHVAARLEFAPDYLFNPVPPDRPALINGSNKPVYFSHILRNNWSQGDTVDLSALFNPVTGWAPPRFWPDPDGDGNIKDCFPPACSEIDNIFLPANGVEDVHLVVEVFIPPDQPKGKQVTTAVTAISTLPGAPAVGVIDQLVVSNVATYRDALPPVGIATTTFSPCDTIYVQGETLLKSDTTTYTLVYVDAAGRTVHLTRPLVTDFYGVGTDSYATGGDDAPGIWTIELRDADALTIGSIELLVQGDVAVLPFRTTFANEPIEGADLGVNALLFNTGVAPLSDTTVDYLVLDPTETRYLRSASPTSTFQPYTGAEVTHSTSIPYLGPGASFYDSFTVPNVTYPARGAYTLRATWKGPCPMALLATDYTFFVGLRWGSFADAARSIPNDSFPQGNTAYMSGDIFEVAVAYTVAYYDPAGNRKDEGSYDSVSDYAGVLRDSLDTAGATPGTWTAAVYRTGLVPPGVFTASDPDLIIADTFAVSAARDTTAPVFAGDKFGDETSACPDAPMVHLGWGAATDTVSPPVGYNVYRSLTGGFVPILADRIASGIAGLTYDDATVACGATYSYVIRAQDSASPPNEDRNLDHVTVTVVCPPPVPPAALHDELRVSYDRRDPNAHPVLDWSRWSPASDVTHAHVYRSTGGNGPWARISAEAPGATFADTTDGSAGGPVLFYQVRPAIDCLDTESLR